MVYPFQDRWHLKSRICVHVWGCFIDNFSATEHTVLRQPNFLLANTSSLWPFDGNVMWLLLSLCFPRSKCQNNPPSVGLNVNVRTTAHCIIISVEQRFVTQVWHMTRTVSSQLSLWLSYLCWKADLLRGETKRKIFCYFHPQVAASYLACSFYELC